MQKFKMAAKSGRKTFCKKKKKASRFCRYPTSKKFCRKCFISLCYQDKRFLAFYAEIKDGCQKWRENDFWETVANRLCRYPVDQKFRQNRSISLCFRDKRFFCILQINSRWLTKVEGKQIFRIVASRV